MKRLAQMHTSGGPREIGSGKGWALVLSMRCQVSPGIEGAAGILHVCPGKDVENEGLQETFLGNIRDPRMFLLDC